MKKEQERLKRALEVSLEQEWRTIPEEAEIWKMHQFSPEFLEKMRKLQKKESEELAEKKISKKKAARWQIRKKRLLAACMVFAFLGSGWLGFDFTARMGRNTTGEEKEMAAEGPASEKDGVDSSAQSGGAVMETQAAVDSWLCVSEFFEAPGGVWLRSLAEDSYEDSGYLLTGEKQERLKEILLSAELTEGGQPTSAEEEEQNGTQAVELRIPTARMEIYASGVYLTGEDGFRHACQINGEGGAEAFWQKIMDFYQKIAESQEIENESGS